MATALKPARPKRKKLTPPQSRELGEFFRYWKKTIPRALAYTEGTYHTNPVIEDSLNRPLLRGGLSRRHFEHQTVLDVGTGQGRLARLAKEFKARKVVGVDVESIPVKGYAAGRHDERFAKGMAEKLPFKSESFGVVTMGRVLEHSSAPKRMLKEAARVLKPKGTLIAEIQEPASVHTEELSTQAKSLVDTLLERGASRQEVREVQESLERHGLPAMFSRANLEKLLSNHFEDVKIVDLNAERKKHQPGLKSVFLVTAARKAPAKK